MRYEQGREEKWRNYMSPDRLEAPFKMVTPEKTLIDAKLLGKVENGRLQVLVNFFDDKGGEFVRRVSIASFNEREHARLAIREILGISSKHKPEIVSVG